MNSELRALRYGTNALISISPSGSIPLSDWATCAVPLELHCAWRVKAGRGPASPDIKRIFFCLSLQVIVILAGCAASTPARRANRIAWFLAAAQSPSTRWLTVLCHTQIFWLPHLNPCYISGGQGYSYRRLICRTPIAQFNEMQVDLAAHERRDRMFCHAFCGTAPTALKSADLRKRYTRLFFDTARHIRKFLLCRAPAVCQFALYSDPYFASNGGSEALSLQVGIMAHRSTMPGGDRSFLARTSGF